METRTKEQIGQRIKELRDAALWSQTQLAEALQVDIRQIGRLERGQSSPKLETLDQIARIFGTDLAGFFAPMGTACSDEPVFPRAHLLTPEDTKILRALINHLIATRNG